MNKLCFHKSFLMAVVLYGCVRTVEVETNMSYLIGFKILGSLCLLT